MYRDYRDFEDEMEQKYQKELMRDNREYDDMERDEHHYNRGYEDAMTGREHKYDRMYDGMENRFRKDGFRDRRFNYPRRRRR